MIAFFSIKNIVFEVHGYAVSYLEFIGTLAGIISVWFAAKNSVLTWIIGLVYTLASLLVFYQIQLYGDVFLQIYYLVISLYGWYNWSAQKNQIAPPLQITFCTKKEIYIQLIIFISAWLLIYLSSILAPKLLTNLNLQPPAYAALDSFLAALSIGATLLLAKRKIENWLVWILVDFISIFLYIQKGVLFFSIEYLVFLILGILGWFAWKKELNLNRNLEEKV